ncbi:hypothetical protein F4808DRAFT_463717 [Astrocystis sublimbata]|nr:hypothetical protein F4808DRAFT_463717 [Astrocystis sublimbata]
MQLMSTVLFGLLASAAPLSSSHSMNSDEVDFNLVGDTYKRTIKDPGEVESALVGDLYKRTVNSAEEVNFDRMGDTY